ncbi:unnamed protein product, partial [marine sediment metagenome]
FALTTYLAEGDLWERGEPIGGVELEIESSCGNEYANIISDSDGKYSVTVKGPIHMRLPKDSPYFGAGHYLHNKNTRGDIRIKEGKEVIINILNSEFQLFPKSKNILVCEGGVYTFGNRIIQLTKNLGECELFVHDNKKYFKTRVSESTTPSTLNVELTEDLYKLPDLTYTQDETVIMIQKGWNLLPVNIYGTKRTTCFSSGDTEEKTSFFYDIISKEYIHNFEDYYETLDPTIFEQYKNQILGNWVLGSIWFYSPIDCQMTTKFEEFENEVENDDEINE